MLCLGIYVADRSNTARHVIDVLSRSRRVSITQRWIALDTSGAGATDIPGTVEIVTERKAKWPLVNRLLAGVDDFDWVLVCDDDIELPEGFADALIAVAEHADFALCQPARTHDSYIDHPFVARLSGLLARQTRFVEIGPVVCMRRDAARLLMPFPERHGMGWGLDFVWPVLIENAGLRMGIIDAVPVAHRMRKPVTGYDYTGARREMARTLALEPHLSPEDAFRIVQVFS
jgi:hypothetical protein